MTDTRLNRLLLSTAGIILSFSLVFCACGRDTRYDESEYGLHLENPDVVSEAGPDMPEQEELFSQTNDQGDTNKVSVTINADPNFLDGENEGDLFISCYESSQYPVVVQIIREDTDETIYTSEALQPGDEIKYDVLDVALDAGDYPCVVYYYAVETTGEICSFGLLSTTIHVQS